jgi:hypothetical protein
MINSFVIIKKINVFSHSDQFIMEIPEKGIQMSIKCYFKWWKFISKQLNNCISNYKYFETEFVIIESPFIKKK